MTSSPSVWLSNDACPCLQEIELLPTQEELSEISHHFTQLLLYGCIAVGDKYNYDSSLHSHVLGSSGDLSQCVVVNVASPHAYLTG